MSRPTRDELIAAQLREWPDSRIVEIDHVMNVWLNVPLDSAYVSDEQKSLVALGVSEMEARFQALDKALLRSRESSLRNARGVILALTYHPEVVFYECSQRPDGTYRHRGARYGVEGREYASGFEPFGDLT